MLLTLTSRSVNSLLQSGRLTLFDLPSFAINTLQLRGLNLLAANLAGWSAADLDTLRDRADKAACPCLVLVQNVPLKLGDDDMDVRDEAIERIQRLAFAANRLGCNAIAVHCEGDDTEDVFEYTTESLKDLMGVIEQMELNLLVAPNRGLTEKPDRLTDLIKRIGGFRIGSLPSFDHAANTGELIGSLRKLAPYAGAIHASIRGFSAGADAEPMHDGYDLKECVEAIRSVGFTNTLAIDYIGTGDPIAAIELARDRLDTVIEQMAQQ